MTTTIRWSPFTPKLHFHHLNDLFPGFIGAPATEEPAERTASWLPAAEGRIEDGTYVIQMALPGIDPKQVSVSLMDNVLTVKGERKANHDTTAKEYFVREFAYGAFQRSFALPEGVDGAQVEAKYVNGMLEVRVPAPRAAAPRTIEIKAA
jgi:HSP20 family protein